MKTFLFLGYFSKRRWPITNWMIVEEWKYLYLGFNIWIKWEKV